MFITLDDVGGCAIIDNDRRERGTCRRLLGEDNREVRHYKQHAFSSRQLQIYAIVDARQKLVQSAVSFNLNHASI